MGVILQQMLAPQFSGVLFSRDPFSGEKNLLIEYVEGLNEALVSGEKTPQQLHFNPAANKFLEEEIPPFAKELVRLAQKLQKRAGRPVDIEWSVQQGKIYFLQFRPITGAMRTILWTDENVGEVIPDIVTPYSWSILEPLTNRAFAAFLKRIGLKNYPQEGLFGLYKGKVYFNNTAFNELMQAFYISKKLRLSKLPRLLVFLLRAGWLNFRLPARIKKRLVQSSREVAFLEQNREARGRDAQKLIRRIRGNHEKTMALHITCTIFAELYYQLLDKLCQKWLPAKDRLNADTLLSGLNRAASADSGRALLDIACRISGVENIRQLFLTYEFPEIKKRLQQDEKGRQVLGEIELFIKEFGHSSLHEFELLYPRWNEDPSYIYTNLKNYLAAEAAQQWKEREKEVVRSAGRHLQEALGKLSFAKRIIFRFIYKRAAAFASQRENLKQAFVKQHAILKSLLLALGKEAAGRGLLENAQDMLYFSAQEIDEWTQGAALAQDSLQTVALRKEERNKNMRFEHPPKIRQQGNNWQPLGNAVQAGTDGLQGIGCSAGVAEGIVRVMRTAEESAPLQKGEILVTRSTNPGWTPLFVLASAVVTEIGGALSHGAIIAREYGLPMVAAVPGVTQRLKTGQRVRVDGHAGVVEILS